MRFLRKGLFVKIKSFIHLLFFIKQVSEWTRFVKFQRSQKFSSLFLSELELFVFTQSFTNYFIYFFNEYFNITRWWRPIFTKTDPLFLWNCKHYTTLTDALTTIRCIIFSLLQIKSCLTNSLSPVPCLCLSLLVLTLYPLGLNWAFRKLSSNLVSVITGVNLSEFPLNQLPCFSNYWYLNRQ